MKAVQQQNGDPALREITEELSDLSEHMVHVAERCEMMMLEATASGDWDLKRDLQHVIARVEATSHQLDDTLDVLHRVTERNSGETVDR